MSNRPTIPTITSDAEHDARVAEIDVLIDKASLTPEEDARLGALGDAVYAYEQYHELPTSSDREDEVFMPCDCPGCGRESTRSISRWLNEGRLTDEGHMAVDYFCEEHAPAGATTFEEDEREIEDDR